MIENEKRFELEKSLINTMLNYESRFFQLYNFSCNSIDLFHNSTLRKIFNAAKDYYSREQERPDYQKFFIKYLNDVEIKSSLLSLNKIELAYNGELEFRLIEDSIEKRARKKLNEIESEKFSGLDYAEKVSDELSKILINFRKEYSTPEQSNFNLVRNVLDDIDGAMRGEKNNYIKTGFNFLDQKTNGIPKGHLTIIAARPGMGKTAFMLQLKRNLMKQGLKPGIISLEMTAEQLTIRNLSNLTKIDSLKIECGNITPEERALIYKAAEKLKEDNYFIDATPNQTPEKIKATLQKWLLKNNVDIVFIDYMTLIRTNYNKQRYDLEIGQLSQDLREFAKETGLPIVILSQLNREVEKRLDRKPNLSDLRETGQLEQDANLVLFLYRPMQYGLNPLDSQTQTRIFPELLGYEFYDNENNLIEAEEFLELIIGKARAGKTGIVPLRYGTNIHAFENIRLKKRVEIRNNGYEDSNNYYEPVSARPF